MHIEHNLDAFIVRYQARSNQSLHLALSIQTERELTDEELIEQVHGQDDEEADVADNPDGLEAEKVVACPSLEGVREQLEGLSVFVAENVNFSTQDELAVARLMSKVSRMTVSKLAHKQQQSILSYFAAVNP